MKFKKVPIDDNAKSGKEMIIELESGEHVYMLINKLNSDFKVFILSKKPILGDQDIYFVAPDRNLYKAKKETFEFIERFGANIIKAEFERIKEEGEQ